MEEKKKKGELKPISIFQRNGKGGKGTLRLSFSGGKEGIWSFLLRGDLSTLCPRRKERKKLGGGKKECRWLSLASGELSETGEKEGKGLVVSAICFLFLRNLHREKSVDRTGREEKEPVQFVSSSSDANERKKEEKERGKVSSFAETQEKVTRRV